MSALVHQDYASAVESGHRGWLRSLPLRRLVIAVAGCALMAISGSGLASYLGTTSATGADAAPTDTASLN